MSETSAAIDRRRLPRSWRTFSLRTMLIVCTALGILLGLAPSRVRLRLAIKAVREAGGDISYEPGPLVFAADYLPTWLEDWFGTVVGVNFTQDVDAKTMAALRRYLERFSELKTLTSLWGWRDTEVFEPPPLPTLEWLQVRFAGPAGSRIAQYSRLPHLERLWISGRNLGTDWTVFREGWPALDDLSIDGLDDAGAESLAKNLRKISTLRLHNPSLSEPGLRAIASIPGLKTVILNENPGLLHHRTRSDYLQRKQRIEELLPQAKVIGHWR